MCIHNVSSGLSQNQAEEEVFFVFFLREDKGVTHFLLEPLVLCMILFVLNPFYELVSRCWWVCVCPKKYKHLKVVCHDLLIVYYFSLSLSLCPSPPSLHADSSLNDSCFYTYQAGNLAVLFSE